MNQHIQESTSNESTQTRINLTFYFLYNNINLTFYSLYNNINLTFYFLYNNINLTVYSLYNNINLTFIPDLFFAFRKNSNILINHKLNKLY